MSNKDEELMVMHSFREIFPDFPKAKLQISESPDFILKLSPKKKIGIELTSVPASENIILDLYNRIEKKENKLYLYRKKIFHELWLIIYINNDISSIHFNLRNKIENLKFESGFNKVILFNPTRVKNPRRERSYFIISEKYL